MRVEQAIARADDLAPNSFSVEQKIAWLSALDQKILDGLILPGGGKAPFGFFPGEGYISDSEELLVQFPYCDDLYSNYLLAQYAAYNGEITKYSNFAALYNSALKEFYNFWTRNHKSPDKGWQF